MKILTLAVTLTLKTTINSFDKTLRLIMLYHQTKFGCKAISSSEDIIKPPYFVYTTPQYDLDHEDS